jgi:spermidine/putrescine transport system ATP-binding protein
VVLLLDEPLGALDLKLREQMKVELKTLQAEVGTTFVYITHDQSEALVMSDQVAVMNRGRFEQVDTPQNLYRHPRTSFVARFVGENNRWSGIIRKFTDGVAEIETAGGRIFRMRQAGALSPGAPVDVYIRPEAMLIEPAQETAGLNRLEVTVKTLLFDGANSRILASPSGGAAELLIALPQNRRYDHIRAGSRVEVGWDERSGICLPADPAAG